MANNSEYNISPSEHESFALNKQGRENERTSTYEEQNNNNLVDVESKDSSKTYNVDKLCFSRGIAIKKLQAECNNLKDELKKTGSDLESYRKTFETITGELKKQLDVAKKRESDSLAQTIGLRLENEKLQILLESKQTLVDKLKKELLNVKRVLKFAIKDICNVSGAESILDFEDSSRSPRSPRTPRSPRVRFADSDDAIDKKTRHETQKLPTAMAAPIAIRIMMQLKIALIDNDKPPWKGCTEKFRRHPIVPEAPRRPTDIQTSR